LVEEDTKHNNKLLPIFVNNNISDIIINIVIMTNKNIIVITVDNQVHMEISSSNGVPIHRIH